MAAIICVTLIDSSGNAQTGKDVDLYAGDGTGAKTGDFTDNGDGTYDVGIFRGGSGLWAIKGETRIYFGATGDWPVPYNGAQLEKYIAIYRPSSLPAIEWRVTRGKQDGEHRASSALEHCPGSTAAQSQSPPSRASGGTAL